jgi:RimJ/RimL family protein N-acetyltransferase
MDLETIRLKILQIEGHDLEEIHNKNLIFEVAEFNTIGIPKNIQETEALIVSVIQDKLNEERKRYGWVIRIKETDEFIGEIGIILSEKRFKKAEIYYSFLPRYWGKGYATEAVKSIINFGFQELKLHRMEAGVATENMRSIKILEKIGMRREGLKRKILPIRGEWKDNYHYAILENDERTY